MIFHNFVPFYNFVPNFHEKIKIFLKSSGHSIYKEGGGQRPMVEAACVGVGLLRGRRFTAMPVDGVENTAFIVLRRCCVPDYYGGAHP